MSFLNNNSEFLSCRITNKGRENIAKGNFVISYFQIGDSEFDYEFSDFDGSSLQKPAQKIFTPMDNDSIIKYPYKISDSTISGITYGQPIEQYEKNTITNLIGPAGFVTSYIPYSTSPVLTGTSIICETCEIDITGFTGTNLIEIPTGTTFSGTEYITAYFNILAGSNKIIHTEGNSQVYKIIATTTGVTHNELELDRATPNLSEFTGTITLISNYCDSNYVDPGINCVPQPIIYPEQQDPWTLNIVWSQKPAGLDEPIYDENLTGYTSNVFVSTKELLGYNTSSGQTINTGTTIVNSCNETIIVPPEEQHSLAVIYYNGIGDYRDPDKFFKYEDRISYEIEDDINYFEVYIPFLLYHRNTGATIGARFFMDTTDYYINSTATGVKTNKFKFRYLIDEQGIRVGKILVNHKTIIFDDQEIIAALDYKTNRRYTLPIPQVNLIPSNIACTPVVNATPLLNSTGDTVFISYLFEVTGNTEMNAMHCNYYPKATGSITSSNVSVNFCSDGFNYMTNELSGYTSGFIANSFKILAQKVTTGSQPISTGWKVIDFTNDIPNHALGDLINPENMKNSIYIITDDLYESAPIYDIESYLGEFPNEPSSEPEFGDQQPFPGSIKLARATDIYTMNYIINLPSNQFETTQNPSWYVSSNKPKRISDVALLDGNKDVIVIGKFSKPILRTGAQQIAVKIDF